MDAVLKEALGTVTLKRTGKGGGGCINEGEAYLIDTGTVFVKKNKKSQARLMFDGEYESLKTINSTNTVKVPKPIVVLDNPTGGAAIVMEYLDMKSMTKFSKQLGEQMARLHLHNIQLGKHENGNNVTANRRDDDNEEQSYISQFGFHKTTCCGYIPEDNTWNNEWVAFFTRQRLDLQLKMIEKDYGDREVTELWSKLQLKIPSFFKDIEIKPSLLHGDLWGGNIAETATEPVIFDPASFYGHHEFELSISAMFGGFNSKFYDAYHELIPKAPGWRNREKLYQLFHYLNHWNHFGTGYRGSSISIMKSLV